MAEYFHVSPLKQPDRTACWSTTLSWWTQAVKKVTDATELSIMGDFQSMCNTDGTLTFPLGFKSLLQDKRWNMKVAEYKLQDIEYSTLKTMEKNGPVVLGYWSSALGSYHAVAAFGFKKHSIYGYYVMDPWYGKFVPSLSVLHHFSNSMPTIVGYL
jgi:hypothetical protein